jgi:hypothetical protein
MGRDWILDVGARCGRGRGPTPEPPSPSPCGRACYFCSKEAVYSLEEELGEERLQFFLATEFPVPTATATI